MSKAAELTEVREFHGDDDLVVVTGGTGGVGVAACELLAARGANIVLVFRSNSERAEEVAAKVRAAGRRAYTVQADLADEGSCGAIGEVVAANFSAGVAGVIHAAGPFVPQIHANAVSADQLRHHLDAEVVAFFNAVNPLISPLREAKGSVVAVTTAALRRYPPRDVLSTAPKAAVEALVRGYAVEEGRYGVRFNSVAPGMLKDGMATEMIASGEIPQSTVEAARKRIALNDFGTVADVAEAAYFLVSGRAKYITGQVLDIDGGYVA